MCVCMCARVCIGEEGRLVSVFLGTFFLLSNCSEKLAALLFSSWGVEKVFARLSY